MMTFDGGGAFFAEEDHRGNWQELEGGAIIVLGLRTILLLQRKEMELEKGLNGVRNKY
jgi:hypothetical protein